MRGKGGDDWMSYADERKSFKFEFTDVIGSCWMFGEESEN